MKKTLVVVVVTIAIGLFASVSSAQTPHVVVYFDNTMTQMEACCPDAPDGTVAQQLYVVANNFNMWVSAIEYMISYPAPLMFLGDIVDDHPIDGTQLRIGASPTGIGIAWRLPANGFDPLLCQKASVLWMCHAGDGTADQLLMVLPFPSSGLVRAIRWPDEVSVTGIGLTSVVCGNVIPVEETTWGGIKALYNE